MLTAYEHELGCGMGAIIVSCSFGFGLGYMTWHRTDSCHPSCLSPEGCVYMSVLSFVLAMLDPLACNPQCIFSPPAWAENRFLVLGQPGISMRILASVSEISDSVGAFQGAGLVG